MRFGVHRTDPSELGEVILVRECSIEYGGQVSPLTLSFTRPKRIGDDEVWAGLRFECQHFDETLTDAGSDDAASEAFRTANEGKTLMPSHRVAIELDRPGVTTYAVQPDGSDRLAGLIGPDDMKGISPDELCRRLGRMILNESEEGRQLLARRREAADYPTNARSST